MSSYRRPSFWRIADDLQAEIHAGRYPVGAAIPSYSGLCQLYEVSAPTVQRAIALLKDCGLVEGIQGRGVFVRATAPTARPDVAGARTKDSAEPL